MKQTRGPVAGYAFAEVVMTGTLRDRFPPVYLVYKLRYLLVRYSS